MDKTNNIWKRAARVLELESRRWSEIGLEEAEELGKVATKLTQLGYLPLEIRTKILRRIDDEEQKL